MRKSYFSTSFGALNGLVEYLPTGHHPKGQWKYK